MRLAFHDPLTGLANRALLNDRVAHALARTEREPGLVAMLLIDVDDFKRINDAHGHDVGDRLLVAVARRLRDTVRSGRDHRPARRRRVRGPHRGAGRGGEAPRDRPAPGRRVRRAVQDRGAAARARGSAWAWPSTSRTSARRRGCCAPPTSPCTRRRAWARAAGASYDPQAHLASARRLVLESELRRAVEHKQFVLHYQPVRDLRHRRDRGQRGAAALEPPQARHRRRRPSSSRRSNRPGSSARWDAGWWTRPAARRPMWAIAACRRSAGRRSTCPQPSSGAARSSGSSAESLLRHRLDASRLSIEITESLALDDSPETADLLRRLRELGARIAVDDFGTGYSSLAYLRRLPIDRIKIDRSFVEGVGTRPGGDRRGARHRGAGARACASRRWPRGSSSELQARTLAELGCDMGQGYPACPSAGAGGDGGAGLGAAGAAASGVAPARHPAPAGPSRSAGRRGAPCAGCAAVSAVWAAAALAGARSQDGRPGDSRADECAQHHPAEERPRRPRSRPPAAPGPRQRRGQVRPGGPASGARRRGPSGSRVLLPAIRPQRGHDGDEADAEPGDDRGRDQREVADREERHAHLRADRGAGPRRRAQRRRT